MFDKFVRLLVRPEMTPAERMDAIEAAQNALTEIVQAKQAGLSTMDPTAPGFHMQYAREQARMETLSEISKATMDLLRSAQSFNP